MHDEGPAKRFVGVEQLIFEPHAPAQIQRPWILRREHVGTAFDQISVSADRFQNPADSMTRFEQRHLRGRLEFDEPMCGRQSGDTSADHGDSSCRFVGS